MTALEELADRCGIEAQFTDARGETRHTSPETRRALLAAMGIAADDEAAARSALTELDRLEWSRPLPPVYVVTCDGPPAVEVNLPPDVELLTWHIALEDGGECRGEARVDALALLRRPETQQLKRERRRLVLSRSLPPGYHQLHVEPGGGRATLIVSPGKCWLPDEIGAGRRLWGVAAQLYLLRSATNWGIGDYGDLRTLAQILRRRGADLIGLNPLHALFLDAPEQASPYSPASRLLLNVLNIEIVGLPELADCPAARALLQAPAFKHALRRCRAAQLVDYAQVADLKLPVLRLLFESLDGRRQSQRWRAFEAFRREGGEALQRGCLFDTLRQHFAAQSAARADWRSWPPDYRDPESPAVQEFAQAHAELVSFRAWLEFAADAQLGAAAQAAVGMAVGLYRDMAVGADPSGAETWANQRAVISEAQVGAPPDIYNPPGQDWGLPPFNPRALREEAYRSFIDLVRANMRHAGGLRIDHVMALQQLYWIPKGRSPAEGAYVRYPVEDLIGILALESQRNRCLVVGEDLGTVPAGFRERMRDANILSYRVLCFERDDAGFLPPDQYAELALAVAGSHDLPTLRGWWEAGDLELKRELRLFPKPEDASRATEERRRDRADLVDAFRRAALPASGEMGAESLYRVAHRFLARSAAALAVAQLDDITDESTPVNVPTTSGEHPNWRRRQSMTLEELAEAPRLAALVDIFRQERGPPPA